MHGEYDMLDSLVAKLVPHYATREISPEVNEHQVDEPQVIEPQVDEPPSPSSTVMVDKPLSEDQIPVKVPRGSASPSAYWRKTLLPVDQILGILSQGFSKGQQARVLESFITWRSLGLRMPRRPLRERAFSELEHLKHKNVHETAEERSAREDEVMLLISRLQYLKHDDCEPDD